MTRVVITGYGVASPIGNDSETFLESLQEGKNGIGPITCLLYTSPSPRDS